MSSGSWDRGNGVATPTPGTPKLVWTRSWSGADSIQTRYTPHPVVTTYWKRVGSRKVTVRSYQKTKSGNYRWVTREIWVTDRRLVTSTRAGYTKFRITSPEQARGIYPSSIVSMLPNAVKRREDMAGLNDRDPVVEELPSSNKSVARFDSARPPKRARLADNAYSMVEQYMRDVGYMMRTGAPLAYGPLVCGYYPDKGWAVSTWIPPSWGPINLMDANDHIRVINNLREKVIGSDFNAAVVLGELSESVDLIVNSAVRINRYLTELRRGNFVAATKALVDPRPHAKTGTRVKRSAKEIASQHLQNEYGWKPLLQDAVTGAEALAHALNTPVQKTYRVSVRKEMPLSYMEDVAESDCNGSIEIRTTGARTQRYGIIARFREKPSLPKLLGLLDPEVVLWEKVPFSFVADWFIPIGDWLTARGFAQGLDATFVISDKRVGTVFEPVIKSSRLFKPNPSDGEMLFKWVTFNRSISASLTVPPPSEKPLAKALSWGHMTNAIALLLSNHGGRGYK